MTSREISFIIDYYRPKSEYKVGDTYESLEWYSVDKPTKEEFDLWIKEGDKIRKNFIIKNNREQAYKQESDPIYFKYQRNESSKEEWINKIKEIKERYPYE